MLVTISDGTIEKINEISKHYGLKVIYNPQAKFQGESDKQKKEIVLNTKIDTDEFNRLFQQLGQSFNVKLDQEMFIFNTFHEIGHFELNLWPQKATDPIITRLDNLEIDKHVNKWAYKQLNKWWKKLKT